MGKSLHNDCYRKHVSVLINDPKCNTWLYIDMALWLPATLVQKVIPIKFVWGAPDQYEARVCNPTYGGIKIGDKVLFNWYYSCPPI